MSLDSLSIKQYKRDGLAKLASEIWKQKILLLFILPAFVFVLVFQYRPMYGVIMAFQKYDILKGLSGSEFVGLENFREFLQTPDFYNALKNTLGLNFLTLVIAFPLPIIFSIVLNELRSDRFRKTVQSIAYLPHFISWVVIAGLFYKMLEQDGGIINLILERAGLERIGFFREARYFWGIYIISSIWKELGWNSILYLASITGIDPQLYEASEIDGANRIQRIWNITIPGITPTIIVLLILTIGSFFSSGGAVGAILCLRNPMVSEASDVIDVYALISGIQLGHYSYAAAIGLSQSFLSFILLFSVNKIIKKTTGYALF